LLGSRSLRPLRVSCRVLFLPELRDIG
jgi:hypothetical protein